MKSSYEICEYKTIDVPKVSVEKRVQFILQTIGAVNETNRNDWLPLWF